MTTEQAKETEEVQGNMSITFRGMCFIPYGVHLMQSVYIHM